MLLQSIKVLNMVKLYGKAIRINKASQDKNSNEVGANLFIGNLDPEVDEKVSMLCYVMLFSVFDGYVDM
jgi:hypothetical protein